MTWAIVEVFGHQKHAGLCSEGTIAGAPVLVVTQPAHDQVSRELERYPGQRHRQVIHRYPEQVIELGGAAIFRRTQCSEEEAAAALRYCTHLRSPERIEGPWEEPPARPALTGPVEDAEEVDDGIPFDDDSEEAPSAEEQERRFALALQPCPRGPCTECAGADPQGHHWDDASRDIDDARQECRHCDAERPYPDDDGSEP